MWHFICARPRLFLGQFNEISNIGQNQQTGVARHYSLKDAYWNKKRPVLQQPWGGNRRSDLTQELLASSVPRWLRNVTRIPVRRGPGNGGKHVIPVDTHYELTAMGWGVGDIVSGVTAGTPFTRRILDHYTGRLRRCSPLSDLSWHSPQLAERNRWALLSITVDGVSSSYSLGQQAEGLPYNIPSVSSKSLPSFQLKPCKFCEHLWILSKCTCGVY